jgi:hydrogenase 3 maturation protease
MNKDNLKESLQTWLSNAKRIVVAGVGNPLRRDDFVGMKIVQGLKGKVSENVFLIECETVPESFIQEIEEFGPSHVLVIDAAIIGKSPGSAELVEKLEVTTSAISTHRLPLQLFCKYLKTSIGAQVALLAIQPNETDFGEGLTSEVEKTAEDLTEILVEVLSSEVE